MVTICLALAAWHYRNWRRSGRRSEILETESRAAVVDAVISGGAGGGLLAASLLRGTALGFIVPVADSVVVLVMCAFIARQPAMMFLGALREVAGAAAEPAAVERVRSRLRELLRDRPYDLLEVAVTKMGRTHFTVAYVKPDAPVDGDAADALWVELDATLRELLGLAKCEIVIAARPPYEA